MKYDNEDSTVSPGDTKKVILDLLLEGPKTSGEIADKLRIQKSAVRIHLNSLQAQKTVKSYFKVVHLGRPRRMYELTESGRELFPRRYDLFLSLLVKKIERTEGPEHLKRIVKSIADDIAADIKKRMENNNSTSDNYEESLKLLNSISNEMGFVSSIHKEDKQTFSLISRNCVLHKVALSNPDTICHGFHERIIQKTLEGKNVDVELKECIAFGDSYSRHVITKSQHR